jgi:hypothetical protein
LYRIHEEDPAIPVDPALFVAVQPGHPSLNDPWAELTETASARRYRSRIRQIVRGLENELRVELLRAERRIRRGESIERVLLTKHQSLSPLGCYITARRAGRVDLSEQFRAEAIKQHQACPLYQQAVLRLLPAEEYPVNEPLTALPPSPTVRLKRSRVSLN